MYIVGHRTLNNLTCVPMFVGSAVTYLKLTECRVGTVHYVSVPVRWYLLVLALYETDCGSIIYLVPSLLNIIFKLVKNANLSLLFVQ
jgi:hypothetical protein